MSVDRPARRAWLIFGLSVFAYMVSVFQWASPGVASDKFRHMAIVTRFSHVTKDRLGSPKTTECGVASVELAGTRYLLLESYGAADRALPGKVSQSLHIDRERAIELKQLLEESFPGI